MGRICNTEAGTAGCGSADSQERERDARLRSRVCGGGGSNRLDGWLV